MSQEPEDNQSDTTADDARPSSDDSGPAGDDSGPAEPTVVVLLRRVDNVIGIAEQALLCLFLLILISSGVIQAITIKLGMAEAEWKPLRMLMDAQVLRYSVFFIAMTGAALSAHTNQLIAMDFVTRMLSRAGRIRLKLLLRAFTVGICGLLVEGGLQVAGSVSSSSDKVIDPALGLLALPIGAGLIGWHVLVQLIIDGVYLAGGRLPPDPLEQRSLH